MCASYESHLNVTSLMTAFAEARLPLTFPAGRPNIEPIDEVRPTDVALAIRASEGDQAQLVPMRFGFVAAQAKGRPVVNFRSEGRTIRNQIDGGRCLIPVSGFYEFTGDKYPKTRWIFRAADAPFLALVGVWRAGETDAFSLLTAEPGPDVAPYHDRGVMPLPRDRWADWLFDRAASHDVLERPSAGSLVVEAAPRPR